MRKSRKSQMALLGALGLLFPQMLWGYGYYYMKDNRERANRSAAALYLSEDSKAPQAYDELGPVKKQAGTREACVKRLRRQAWRDKADGIIQVKYSAETLSNKITCEGTTIRWRPTETQASNRNP